MHRQQAAESNRCVEPTYKMIMQQPRQEAMGSNLFIVAFSNASIHSAQATLHNVACFSVKQACFKAHLC